MFDGQARKNTLQTGPLPYKHQGIIVQTVGLLDELLSLRQQLLVWPLIQLIEEFFRGIVLLEMDIFDVLSVRPVDRH